jgi:Flp pilus assembly pilin Flp
MLESLFWFAGIVIVALAIICTISFLITGLWEIWKSIYHAVKEYLKNEDSTDGP